MVYFGKIACPGCGWRPIINGRYVETVDAYLQSLIEADLPKPIDRKEFLSGLRWYAGDRKYNPNWANHKYRDRFGCWPPSQWTHIEINPPSIECLAWIRHVQIQWAHSKRRIEA